MGVLLSAKKIRRGPFVLKNRLALKRLFITSNTNKNKEGRFWKSNSTENNAQMAFLFT